MDNWFLIPCRFSLRPKMVAFSIKVLLSLSLAIFSEVGHARELSLLSLFSPWIKSETLIDNTERATAKTTIPGWVTSGEKTPFAFGVTFKTGPSEYLLNAVTVMVASEPNTPEFDGILKVSLYEVPEESFPPANAPFFETSKSHVKISPSDSYHTVMLDLPRLRANTWYAIAFTAPNTSATRIMGYQIPDVAPSPSFDFLSGVPFYGEAGAWRRLMNPYIWLQGWDVKSEPFIRLQSKLEIAEWVIISLIISLFIVGFRVWFNRRTMIQ